jgi:hypothetical protein
MDGVGLISAEMESHLPEALRARLAETAPANKHY